MAQGILTFLPNYKPKAALLSIIAWGFRLRKSYNDFHALALYFSFFIAKKKSIL